MTREADNYTQDDDDDDDEKKERKKKSDCQPKSSLGRLRREIRSPKIYGKMCVCAILISKKQAVAFWCTCWAMSTAAYRYSLTEQEKNGSPLS